MFLEPMLAPSNLLETDIHLKDVKFPMLSSIKYNGVRCIMEDGIFRSRNSKLLRVPTEIQRDLDTLREFSRNGHILDGEFHANSANTVGQTMSILAGTLPIPDDFKYKIFYTIPESIWINPNSACMEDIISQNNPLPYSPRSEIVTQVLVNSANAFQTMVERERFSSLEGFILINPAASYKHGRATPKENIMFKYKYYGDEEDAVIVGITSRRERKADIPTGKCYTQDSFIDTDVGGCLIVELEKTGEIVNCPFPLNFPLSCRKIAFSRFGTGLPGDIKDKWICFKRLSVEDRGRPIAIKAVQFRDSK